MKKLVLAGVLALGVVSSTGCTLWNSVVKDLESSTSGLDRTITVYDMQGDVIAKYEGENVGIKGDSDGKVVFEVNGKRISLYNVSVIVEEKGE
ncbi:DUF5052 family protein [Bacillus licheniformis]